MSDNPLFDRTLSDVLLRARQEAERSQAKAAARHALEARRLAEEVAERERVARAALQAAERRAREADQLVAAAEQEAARRIADAHVVAERTLAEATQRAALLEREERVRHALIAEQVEERVRAELALDAPPLPELRTPAPPVELPAGLPGEAEGPVEGPADGPAAADVPSVPSVAEVFRHNPGIGRFLDSLVGLPRT